MNDGLQGEIGEFSGQGDGSRRAYLTLFAGISVTKPHTDCGWPCVVESLRGDFGRFV